MAFFLFHPFLQFNLRWYHIFQNFPLSIYQPLLLKFLECFLHTNCFWFIIYHFYFKISTLFLYFLQYIFQLLQNLQIMHIHSLNYYPISLLIFLMKLSSHILQIILPNLFQLSFYQYFLYTHLHQDQNLLQFFSYFFRPKYLI